MIPIAYFLVLPQPHVFTAITLPSELDDENTPIAAEYAPLANDEGDTLRGTEVVDEVGPVKSASVALSLQDKWRLAKPMLAKYMLPLCKQRYHRLRRKDLMPYLRDPSSLCILGR